MDGLYSYNLTLPAGQNAVFVNPFEIIDDTLVEGDESFLLNVTVIPQAGFSVLMSTMEATVIIIDNDSQSFNKCMHIARGACLMTVCVSFFQFQLFLQVHQ